MTKPKLVVSSLVFDTAQIADALHIKPDDVVVAFRDGRGAWPFSEVWGRNLYDFIKHTNTNTPFSDGAYALGQLGQATISVKALTQGGVKFQQSKFVGVGRESTKAALISSLEACDRVVVVDITEFPFVRFIPIDSTRLISAAHVGRLTVGGWTRTKLTEWLNDTYSVTEVGLSLP